MTDETAAWLSFAREDLALAREVKERYVNAACYHAQQAAEKALKALLVERGLPFSRRGGYGHDLVHLNSLLPASDQVGVEAVDLVAVAALVRSSRYPDNTSSPTSHEAEHALAVAQAVVSHVAARLRQG